MGDGLPEYSTKKHNNGGYKMGYLKYVRDLWKKPKENMKELLRERIIAWRQEPVTVRLEHPTRIDRARSLGYKAKLGYIIIRQRVDRGGRMRIHERGGRRPKHFRLRKILDMNYQQIAETRASKQYTNCEVLNSYKVAEDGLYYWYEIILVDRAHPSIIADDRINWICDKKGRSERGLTSAGRKSRGLRHRGKGAEKLRPSRNANLTMRGKK